MNLINVALLQILPDSDVSSNIEIGVRLCKQAKDKGADIILFPELFTIGYKINEHVNNRFISSMQNVEKYSALAKEIDCAIAITYVGKRKRYFTNSISIIDRFGRSVLGYDKIHTCDFDSEKAFIPGKKFYVCDLNTRKGKVKIGAMICFDREFPESARVLMLQGAEIILVPNACVLDENRLNQLSTRAFENMVGIAVCNYSGSEYKGNSVAYDGIAYDNNGQSRKMLLNEINNKESIIIAKFDIDAIRQFRKNEVWGNAYRKVNAYDLIGSKRVNEPFIRTDSKR